MLFLTIPLIFAALTYYTYEEDLVDCHERITCENDDVPDQEIDKFDPKIQAAPKGPGDF